MLREGHKMKWILGLLAFLGFTALSVYPAQNLLSSYIRVESYEVRPDVLAMPKYGADGSLCEIAVEKRHVQRDVVDLGATIPHEVTLQIIDELAPPAKRGKRTGILGKFDYETISGASAVTLLDYENVTGQIFRARSGSGDTAIILRWKNACGSLQRRESIP